MKATGGSMRTLAVSCSLGSLFFARRLNLVLHMCLWNAWPPGMLACFPLNHPVIKLQIKRQTFSLPGIVGRPSFYGCPPKNAKGFYEGSAIPSAIFPRRTVMKPEPWHFAR